MAAGKISNERDGKGIIAFTDIELPTKISKLVSQEKFSLVSVQEMTMPRKSQMTKTKSLNLRTEQSVRQNNRCLLAGIVDYKFSQG